jgi:hypothetical protein
MVNGLLDVTWLDVLGSIVLINANKRIIPNVLRLVIKIAVCAVTIHQISPKASYARHSTACATSKADTQCQAG